MNAGRLLSCLETEERPVADVVPGDVLVDWATSWPRCFVVEQVAKRDGLIGLLDAWRSGTFYLPEHTVQVVPEGWLRKSRERRLEMVRIDRKDLADCAEWYSTRPPDRFCTLEQRLHLVRTFARDSGGTFHLEQRADYWEARVCWPSGLSVVGRAEADRHEGLMEAVSLVLGQLAKMAAKETT
jgi:hypothetical protein